jgi:hypothetical protein
MGRTCYSYGGTERYKKSYRCSGRRKKTEGQAETEMGRRVMEDGVMEDGVMEDGVMGDGVMGDARKLGERNWRNGARNRDSWQKLLKKVLAQKGAVVPTMMMISISCYYSEVHRKIIR